MKRGDVVIAIAAGDYGKPRPAVVVQSDLFNATHASIVVCLLTTDVVDGTSFRLTVQPSASNGLKKRSQIMVDKIVALRRERLKETVGALSGADVLRLNRALAGWLGLGD